MVVRKVGIFEHNSQTQNDIINCATKLFAYKGYEAITMRDIADVVGVKHSSIYYYYKSKEDLMDDIVTRFQAGYRNYLGWLASINNEAASLNELMDNFFNDEMYYARDHAGCLGIALMLRNQHNLESARKCVVELIYRDTIRTLQSGFDILADKGVIPANDTEALAMILTSCVMAANEMRLYEFSGETPPFDCITMYDGLRKILTTFLGNR